jgi:MYST family zinc finger domain
MTLKARKFYYSKSLQKLEVLATKDSRSFVHFLGHDKRNDSWIPTSDLGVMIPPEDLPPLKLESGETEEADLILVRNIESIYIHHYKIDCWYYSPYPFPDEFDKELWICWRCLLYHPAEGQLGRHLKSCKKTTPGKVMI